MGAQKLSLKARKLSPTTRKSSLMAKKSSSMARKSLTASKSFLVFGKSSSVARNLYLVPRKLSSRNQGEEVVADHPQVVPGLLHAVEHVPSLVKPVQGIHGLADKVFSGRDFCTLPIVFVSLKECCNLTKKIHQILFKI